MNLISEKLCAFEVRADTLASAEATAFIARDNDKKTNLTEMSSGKSAKRGNECAKQKFPCDKCKALHRCAAKRSQKQQHAGYKGGKTAIRKNVVYFVAHVMEALRVK